MFRYKTDKTPAYKAIETVRNLPFYSLHQEDGPVHLRATLPPLTLDEAGWRRFAAGTYRAGDDGRWHPRWDIRIAQAMQAGGAMPSLWAPFGALAHVPLMLLRGELSALLSAETAQRMRRERPDMAFLNVPETGHCPTLEEAIVAPALDRFLDAIA